MIWRGEWHWGAAPIAELSRISSVRVASRTMDKNPDSVEAKLEKAVPAPFRMGAHHWLILHGRYVCKARRPECWRCPVADLCAFKPKSEEK